MIWVDVAPTPRRPGACSPPTAATAWCLLTSVTAQWPSTTVLVHYPLTDDTAAAQAPHRGGTGTFFNHGHRMCEAWRGSRRARRTGILPRPDGQPPTGGPGPGIA